MPASAYRDSIHMNGAGREVVTEALEDELDRLLPLSPAPMPRSRPPVRALDVTREGSTPLPELRVVAEAEPCRWSAEIPEVAHLADNVLAAAGLGKASPLLVRVGSERLAPHTVPSRFPEGCAGAALLRGSKLQLAATRRGLGPQDFALELDPSPVVNAGTDDEAWWVYAGTTTRFHVGATGPVHVRVALRALAGAEVVVRARGVEVPLSAADDRRDGEIDLPATEAPWALEVSATGGYAIIEALDVGEPGRERALAGSFSPRVGLRLSWRGDDVPLAVDADSENPRSLAAPALDAIGDDRLQAAGLAGCSVVEVRDAGAVVEHGPRPRAATATLSARTRVGEGRVELPPGEGPATVVLKGRRVCDAGAWVYAAESVAATSSRVSLGRMRAGANALELTGRSFGASDGAIRVVLTAGETPLAEATVPLAELDRGPVRLPLVRRQVGRLSAVTLRVENPNPDAFVIVTSASLLDETAL